VNWWLFWFLFGVKKKNHDEQQSITGMKKRSFVVECFAYDATGLQTSIMGGNLVAEQNTVSKTK
jgi:hypothetical protein